MIYFFAALGVGLIVFPLWPSIIVKHKELCERARKWREAQ